MTNKLELRPLYGDDIFVVMELVNKLDLIEPIKELLSGEMREQIIQMMVENTDEQNKTEVDVEAVGFEIILQISELAIKRIPKAKNEINSFLADLTNSDVETIRKLSIVHYMGLIKDFFGHPDLKELLDSLAQLMKSE